MRITILLFLLSLSASAQVTRHIDTTYHALIKDPLTTLRAKGKTILYFQAEDTATYDLQFTSKKHVWVTTPPVQPVTIQAESFKSKTSGNVVGTLFVPVKDTKVVYALPSGKRNRISFTYSLADAPAIQLKITYKGVLIYDGTQLGKEIAQTGGWATYKTTLPIPIGLVDGGDLTIETNRGFNWDNFTLSYQ